MHWIPLAILDLAHIQQESAECRAPRSSYLPPRPSGLLNLTTKMETVAPPTKLNRLFTLRCAVAPPMEIGHGPYGRGCCVLIKSGSMRGHQFNGEVVPGGADFM